MYDDLAGPGLPLECQHVWFIFMDLHTRRGSNGYGPNPLTYTELESWQRVMNTPLDPLEIRLLWIADAAYLTEYAMQHAPPGKQLRDPDAEDEEQANG